MIIRGNRCHVVGGYFIWRPIERISGAATQRTRSEQHAAIVEVHTRHTAVTVTSDHTQRHRIA